MSKMITTVAMALSAMSLTLAGPASALPTQASSRAAAAVYGDMDHDYGKRDKHRKHGDRYYGERASFDERRYDRYDRDDEQVYRDTRTWRGDDGRYYCRKENGTTGLLIGAGVGGLLGHEVAGRGGDRTLGAVLGAAGGALLGREIDRSGSRCR